METPLELESWKDKIDAVTPQEIRTISTPVEVQCGEAEATAVDANKDVEKFAKAGMDTSYIQALTDLANITRYFEAQWQSEYQSKKEAELIWKNEAPAAYELRKEILHHMTFAYRKDASLIKKLNRIKEGSGSYDLVQDLLEIHTLSEKYPEPLKTIDYDFELSTNALASYNKLKDILAKVNGEKGNYNEDKILRDKAYSLLTLHLNEVREYGRYVFWKDENRKKRYASDYRRN
ncbi:hypothetical protein [Plebeiibacterium marinum]|uniref:Uncharacterized protein n=1 Tax=Plebeiibacterium marinum TaxID=2992111 RepID=A0AAE3SKB8_9BACT|nr:hypothetical protein [Plebeiobacterium marinum]MCW3806394.1 hypothetical protein [Plebeiobacterium marinum]